VIIDHDRHSGRGRSRWVAVPVVVDRGTGIVRDVDPETTPFHDITDI
jgi:hypothetical protein